MPKKFAMKAPKLSKELGYRMMWDAKTGEVKASERFFGPDDETWNSRQARTLRIRSSRRRLWPEAPQRSWAVEIGSPTWRVTQSQRYQSVGQK